MSRSFAKSILPFAAAVMILSGCTQDAILEEAQTNKVFTASIGEVTRTALDLSGEESDFGKVYWEAGDEVSINGVIYVATPESDATTATLTKKTVSDADPEAPYTACYPASIWKDGWVEFPTVQQYGSGADLSGVNPMKAESETTSLSFKNMGALVEVTLKGSSTSYVHSLSLGGIRLSCGSKGTGVALSEAGVRFYVAVPKGSYDKMPVFVQLTSGKFFKTQSNETVDLKGNTLYTLSLEPVFSGREGVQLWEGGPFWATTNLGAETGTDYGLFFQWSGTTGYSREDDLLSSPFTEEAYSLTPGGQLTSDMPESLDAAHVIWGVPWRIPTLSEFETLINEDGSSLTDGGVWKTDYNGTGINGLLITGTSEGFKGRTLFLPAAAGYDSRPVDINAFGFYWSSNRFTSQIAYGLTFSEEDAWTYFNFGYNGYPIRPVMSD